MTAMCASEVMLQTSEEGQLATRVAGGDTAAAQELVRRHQSAVRGFLRSVCYDRQAIDDLAQDTFLRALKYAGRFDPKYSMRGWLLTIARRLSINHGDKAKRRRPEPGVELTQLSDRGGHTPSSRMEDSETQRLNKVMINQAMAKLSEPQRAAIAMHYQQGLALDEIAGLLEMPVGTVKSHLHRGRQKMKEILEPQAERVMR